MGALVQRGGEQALQNLKYKTKPDVVATLSHLQRQDFPLLLESLRAEHTHSGGPQGGDKSV